MTIGEILALKWNDLDYYNSVLNVNRTMIHTGGEGTPKTPASRRALKLRKEVIDALKRQETRSKMIGEYIFPNPLTGNRYNQYETFTRLFDRLLALARLKRRSPNQLRHTFATLHIAAGESVTWVSKMLGHKDVKTTLARYNKYVPNLTHEDGSAFEKAFSKTQDGCTLVTPIRKLSE